MNKELRRLSIVVLAMFLTLFVSVSWIQVFDTTALAENDRNTRALYDSYQVKRGAIIASGAAIASSVPSEDVYSWQRVYADPEMWAPVTGYINPGVGASTGIEKAMNLVLSGNADSQFFARLEQTITGQPQQGSSVVLTLDAKVQKAAYDALGSLKGAAIAIEPATGRVLALVTSPSYDTNTLAIHDTEAATGAYEALEKDQNHPLYNRAIAGDLNPPGSTFKLVVVSAALASGSFTPKSTLPNPASYTLPQSTSVVHNAGGGTCGKGKTVTIADALRLSCNIPMAELAVKLGDDAIREEAEKYGFNHSFDIPLSSTESVYPRALDDPQTALSGFGQGQVTATPLQMAMVSAAIANGGIVMNPYMVDRVIAPDLAVEQTSESSEFGSALDPTLTQQMVTMMIANVQDGAASNARIEGVAVGGKTGTAENGPTEPYSLWFTGFAPADNPKVAVTVVIEDGGGLGQSGTGNDVAAPIAKQIMEAVVNG